jgi:hypothetical protein
MKIIYVILILFIINCKEDYFKNSSDLILDSTDKLIFKNCESFFKKGVIWTEFSYAGFGTAYMNGEKISIYPHLLFNEFDNSVRLEMLFFSENLKELKGQVSIFDIDFEDKNLYKSLPNQGLMPTRFEYKKNNCYSYGAYHIKENIENQSFIKIINFDKKKRLKARFSMILEVNEECKSDIEKVGLPKEITISDGMIFAGFLSN